MISIDASLVSNFLTLNNSCAIFRKLVLFFIYNFEQVFLSSVYNAPILAHSSIFIPNVPFLFPLKTSEKLWNGIEMELGANMV